MKQRMKDFRQWGKEHKGLLAVAGISITGAGRFSSLCKEQG